MRNVTLLGVVAVAATATAGYLLAIAPQARTTDAARSELTTVRATNEQARHQLPILKAQLEHITASVDGLRELSQQVPQAIDLPALYAELDAVAAKAGPGVEVTNVSVSVPALINPDGSTVTAAAAAPAQQADPVAATDGSVPAPTPAPTAPAAPAAAVLASYQISIDLSAGPQETVAFIKALGDMKRLSVVDASGYTAGTNGHGTAHVTATLYLQQVDVDGLAAQIEELSKAGTRD